MASEIFRFAVVRPPQTTTLEKVADNSFLLSSSDEGLIDNLRKAKNENDKTKMIKLAQGYTKSSKFIDSFKKIDPKLIEFVDVVNSNSKTYNQFLRESFQKIFALTPTKFINSPVYKQTHNAVSESLVAAAIDSSVAAKTKSLIINLAHVLQAINLISKKTPVNRQNITRIKVMLPSGIFPLPFINANLKEHRRQQAEKRRKAAEERQKEHLELSEELKSYNTAADEIIKVFDNNIHEGDEGSASEPKRKGGFYLPERVVQKISADTKKVLKGIGLSDVEIDVAKTVEAIEKRAAETAQKIYAFAGSVGRMARIGGNDVIVFDDDLLVSDAVPARHRRPGACPPVSMDTEDDTTPISTNGLHDVRVLGIADLMIVEQELIRYELGEIAHIENVLKSELRDRKHRINNLTEESLTTESEETDTKENDLSSAERFELQTESQNVINESTSIEAGATVSASYGFVDATANFNYASADSSSEIQRTASNFARETTSKAVNKLEKRNLERRKKRTVRETEEINQHTFDNKAGTENITGVYRFVDKVYNAQIVNYGKRLMLEFIVPEPAAFLRHAMTNKPLQTNILKPDEPGFCSGNGRRFVPLKVQDVTRENYLFWASKYGVEDVSPPPAKMQVVSSSITISPKELEPLPNDTGDKDYGFVTSKNINLPDGYVPVNAVINNDDYIGISGDFSRIAHIFIDNKKYDNIGIRPHTFSPGVWKSVEVAVALVNKMFFSMVINIFCRLSLEKEQKWQMQTYNAIMNGYNDQLTRYNNTVETERIRAGFTEITGINPLINRETEKTELKKGCITLLTGQQFEAFDAMNTNVGINGYPEIDFEEAATEGRFISFFEQAFEWNNMTYIFYPYFWANKKQWLQLSQLKDTDPLFTKFLQAGSCRVSVPVRIGFETMMLNYVNSNINWNGEGNLVNTENGEPDLLHVSVVEELKSQLNNMNIEGIGKLSATKDSNVVTGVDTAFTIDDENKRIIFGGETYLVKQVDSPNTLQLKTVYAAETQTGLSYSFGAKLVGEPWEVRLPTDLVKIDDAAGLIV